MSSSMSAFIASIPLVSRGPSTLTRCTRRHSVSHARPRAPAKTTMLADAPLYLAENPAALQTVANAFNSLGMPKWLVEWGHPGMMAFMVLGMGAPGAYLGWQGRLNENKKDGVKQKQLHENIMVAFFLLAFLGGTGGTLSVAMQGYDIWESPHFLSAVAVLGLLGLNSIIAYTGFTIGNDGSPKGKLQGRKLHAYFGVAVMAAFLVHGILGINIMIS